MQLRTITITQEFLHIPVQVGQDEQRYALQILIGGASVREFYLAIADKREGAHYFFYDVSAFMGCEMTLLLPDPGALARSTLMGILQGGAPEPGNPLYPDLYREKLRPGYHFSTKRGWLNDPNGLIYAGGQFHMYYQHNPMGQPHGGVNICWGHAVSQDLLHWTELNDAIVPWRRDWSVASGSAMLDEEGVAGFGKGAIIAAFTALGTHNEVEGRHYASGGQFMAGSIDGGDTFYLFNTQATVPTEGGEGWRDPRIFRYEDHYVMAVYETYDGRNCVSIYTSHDLRNWTRASRNMDLYECPDLFQLTTPEGESRWILYGADGFARIGHFDGSTFTESGDAHPLDYGKAVYAGQTWMHHPEGKRVHISWILGMDGYVCEYSFPDMPFSQCMSIPCELNLVKMDGHFRVMRTPINLSPLHDGDATESSFALRGEYDLPLDQRSEYTFRFDNIEGELGIRAGSHPIIFDPDARLLRFDNGKTATTAGDTLTLRLLIDTTTMELFFDGGIVATYTIHPDNMSLQFCGSAHVSSARQPLNSIHP